MSWLIQYVFEIKHSTYVFSNDEGSTLSRQKKFQDGQWRGPMDFARCCLDSFFHLPISSHFKGARDSTKGKKCQAASQVSSGMGDSWMSPGRRERSSDAFGWLCHQKSSLHHECIIRRSKHIIIIITSPSSSSSSLVGYGKGPSGHSMT